MKCKKWMVVGGVCLVLAVAITVVVGCGKSQEVTVDGGTYSIPEYRTAVKTAIEIVRTDIGEMGANTSDVQAIIVASEKALEDAKQLSNLLPYSRQISKPSRSDLDNIKAWVSVSDAELVQNLKEADGGRLLNQPE